MQSRIVLRGALGERLYLHAVQRELFEEFLTFAFRTVSRVRPLDCLRQLPVVRQSSIAGLLRDLERFYRTVFGRLFSGAAAAASLRRRDHGDLELKCRPQ